MKISREKVILANVVIAEELEDCPRFAEFDRLDCTRCWMKEYLASRASATHGASREFMLKAFDQRGYRWAQ